MCIYVVIYTHTYRKMKNTYSYESQVTLWFIALLKFVYDNSQESVSSVCHGCCCFIENRKGEWKGNTL